MKKNKLYITNKWNQPVFIPKENIFADAGQMQIQLKTPTISPYINWGNKAQVQNALSQSGEAVNNFAEDTLGGLGIGSNAGGSAGSFLGGIGDKLGGIMGGGQLAGTPMGGLVGSLGSAIGGIAGNAISGGLQSDAGNAISGIGSTIGGAVGAVNPVFGAAIGVGSQLVGGLVNAAFGTKVNEAKLKAANEGTAAYNNFTSNASSFDDISGPESQANVQDAYSGGWFSSGEAHRKNEELKRQRAEARSWADRSVTNNIYNLVSDQLNDALVNYASFGGPISYNKKYKTSDMIYPAFMNNFAIGGDIQTNGGDFSDGLTIIGTGGSHEENPYEGVQMGVDNEGTPNLVEEGETVFNDYVYSNRILADEATKKKFRLPKKKDITFADISKKLEKESSERPNDPISQNALQVQMQQLADEQERQKQEMEVQRAREAFESLSPEEQTALMQQREQEELAAQQATEEQAIAEQQAMQQPSPEEAMAQEAMMADGSEANLGNLPTEEQIANVTALGGKLVRVGDLDTKANTFAIGGRKAKRMTKKYNKEWFKQMAESLGMSDEDLAGFEENFKEDNPEANLVDFNRRYRNSQYEKAKETYRTGQRTAKRNELFNPTTGRYRRADDGKTIYERQYRQAEQDWIDKDNKILSQADYDALSDKDKKAYTQITSKVGDLLYNNDKLVENIYDKTEDDILNSFSNDYEKGFKWNDKDAQALNYPAEMEHSAASYLRYAPALGGLVGLLTEGSPDYSRAQDVVNTAKGLSTPPQVSPHYIGNYLTYRPMDIWFGQNRMDANSRATDRAIMNSSNPSRMAGLLANSYNSQIASGNLYRQALEYNDALRQKVEDFNRGTNIFNAQADMNSQRTNASLRQRAGEIGLRGITSGYGMMDAIDARRAAARNANLNNLFTSIGNIGEETFDTDRLKWLEKTGVLGSKVYSANGGKIKKRKNKRGLTY